MRRADWRFPPVQVTLSKPLFGGVWYDSHTEQDIPRSTRCLVKITVPLLGHFIPLLVRSPSHEVTESPILCLKELDRVCCRGPWPWSGTCLWGGYLPITPRTAG